MMNYVYTLIFIFIILYILCYFVFSSEISIFQTTLSEFDFDMLNQKMPIVFENAIQAGQMDVIYSSWFSSNFVNVVGGRGEPEKWHRNHHKYMIYLAKSDDSSILLLRPGSKIINYKNESDFFPDENENIVEIKLVENQFMIIPFKWYFFINGKGGEMTGIDDYVTKILNSF
jgi:hypothetical protein